MPQSLIDIAPLQHHLLADQLILTPNSRLKNKLLQSFNQRQTEQGLSIWNNPRVFAINEWLDLQYESLLAGALIDAPAALASSQQTQQLWLQIIQEHTEGLELINPLRLASDANTAYVTLARWNLTCADVAVETDQQRQFVLWAGEFELALAERGLQAQEQRHQQVNSALRRGFIEREVTVLAMDFGELPPLLKTTFDALSDTVETHRASVAQTPLCSVREYADKDQEVAQAAQWAKQTLIDNPDASIGIVVPNLGQDRTLLARHLTEVFEPHYLLPETARYTLPFNFSTGVPLGGTPVIGAALSLLKLQFRDWDQHQLIELLHSPFLGQPVDLGYTEALIEALQRTGRSSISTQRLRFLVQQQTERLDSEYGQWFSAALQQLEDRRRRTLDRQPASRWGEFFLEQLQCLGWPGQRRLDSNEYQQIQQFYRVIEAFSRLDELGSGYSLFEAIELLSREINATPFQAQTPESPIQVLGALEAAGLLFNHCWVMGMNHREWPPAPQPNPLLPLALQRESAMPHADAERELRYAESLTQGYQKAAREVVFSYAKQGEESHQQASPLIRHLDTECDPIHRESALRAFIESQQDTAQDRYSVHRAPPLKDFERQQVRGGSQILRNQSINPMAAFLIHRLGARQPTPLNKGFSPQQRGQILHDVLANLWDEWQEQSALLALSDEALQARVTAEVTTQAKPYQSREPELFGENYLKLEIQRQSALILGWLEQEKQRPGFTVVAREEALKTQIGGLPLTLRLDRLDALDNGDLIIIDYKTGTPNLKSWGGDRPEEPQLPIYALAYEREIQALLFVQINTAETAAKGIGQLQQYHEGIAQAERGPQFDLPDNWGETIDHWRAQLNGIALEFEQGNTTPQFKSATAQRFYEYLLPALRVQQIIDGEEN